MERLALRTGPTGWRPNLPRSTSTCLSPGREGRPRSRGTRWWWNGPTASGRPPPTTWSGRCLPPTPMPSSTRPSRRARRFRRENGSSSRCWIRPGTPAPPTASHSSTQSRTRAPIPTGSASARRTRSASPNGRTTTASSAKRSRPARRTTCWRCFRERCGAPTATELRSRF